MSAADKYLNKKPFIGHLITFASMIVITLTAHALNNKSSYDKELVDQVDTNTIKLESTVTSGQVDFKISEAFIEHDKRDQIVIQGIKEVISTGNKNIEKILEIQMENLNKRLDKIEEAR